MTEEEKSICDYCLRYGTITSDKELTCEGKAIRQYIITLDGEEYHLNKQNGEWIYFYHVTGRR